MNPISLKLTEGQLYELYENLKLLGFSVRVTDIGCIVSYTSSGYSEVAWSRDKYNFYRYLVIKKD